MKQIILGVALVACFAACKSSQNTSVSDPNSANMPKKECTGGACPAGECSGKAKAECSGAKADCCSKEKPQG
jgi:hypothetical protein